MYIRLHDGTTQDVIEEKCGEEKICAAFADVVKMDAFREKLTDDNLSEFAYEKNSETVGQYKNYKLMEVSYVKKENGYEASFYIRKLTDTEMRLAALEKGQDIQNDAIAEMSEVVYRG